MILQEAWYRLFAVDPDGNRNPYEPIVIDYVNDGVIEIWNNDAAFNWYSEHLLQKNLTDPNFFNKYVSKYTQVLAKLSKYWRKNRLENIPALQNFLDLIEEGTRLFGIYYYSLANDKTPPAIRRKALEIRTEDAFYDNSDRLIRRTLNHVYPDISIDLGISLLRKEIENPPSTHELEARYRNAVVIPDHLIETTSLSDFLSRNQNYEFEFNEADIATNELKGQSAFKGYAKGRVRIIKNKHRIHELQDGEILVSPMTTPHFLSAMKRAAAIVTDEGGITCHAAIVAREFQKPCIVGTKTATKVLKDGDFVEVDATRGVVKKIK